MKNVAILLFDDVEVLDFAGPFEIFSVTAELNDYNLFEVYTVSSEMRPVIARNGLSVNPDYTIANCPRPDILIVPGGEGTRQVMRAPVLLEWIGVQSRHTELTLSVCTGSLVLAAAGLLNGLEATTHHQAFDLFRRFAPDVTLNEQARFVDTGKVITAGGISAGIDMSLHVIERLLGAAQARQTAAYMEYGDWR